jgi:hypothetical protein
MKRVKNILLVFTLLLTIVSCQHKIGDDLDGVEVDVLCDPNTVYFVNDIQPILASNCAYAGCHDAVTKKDGYDFSSYTSLMSSDVVKSGKPDDSELYEVLFESGDDLMPPPPKTALSSDQKEKIRNWILQGAKNNKCLGCDSTNATFSADVWPIIASNCQGCHSGAAPSGGISIINYSQVNSLAQNGSLLGVITSQTGYSPMPKNGKLSDCDIAIIKKWINNGAQND